MRDAECLLTARVTLAREVRRLWKKRIKHPIASGFRLNKNSKHHHHNLRLNPNPALSTRSSTAMAPLTKLFAVCLAAMATMVAAGPIPKLDARAEESSLEVIVKDGHPFALVPLGELSKMEGVKAETAKEKRGEEEAYPYYIAPAYRYQTNYRYST